MNTPAKKVAVTAPPVPTPPRDRILLVDDDGAEREAHAKILTQAGFRVDTAKDGAEAWIALNAGSYDLLITDEKMPRVTGLELIGKVRAADMLLPVILVSGLLPVEALKRQPWLLPDAALHKPFAVARLLATVKTLLLAGESSRLRAEWEFAEKQTGIGS